MVAKRVVALGEEMVGDRLADRGMGEADGHVEGATGEIPGLDDRNVGGQRRRVAGEWKVPVR